MKNATDPAAATPAEHTDDHDEPTPDHPAQTGPRPSRWARLTGWLRRTDSPAEKDEPAEEMTETAIEPRPKPPARPARTALRRPARSRWDVAAVVALAIGVLVIVVVGLRVGMGALQDAARAAHIDDDAADQYWIGVDGLIVVAIVAALVLRNVPGARRYCLAVVGVFTIASGLLQYLHGLGWFTPDPRSGNVPPLPWGVVLVIALLVIGTIFCGTHLLVHVLRKLFPGSPPEQDEHPAEPPVGDDATARESDEPDQSETSGQLDADTEREIRKWFAAIAVGMLLDSGTKPVRSRLAREFGIADRQAGYVIADVIREREEAAERAAEEEAQKAAARAAQTQPQQPKTLALTGIGSVNGSGPAGGAP
ncbi:hypothetical protein AB0395_44790 [Streptosporangium sp. NPDC051023]|uniref:hypothetical protein n=1 Tax=Streptosporangium sp. NPDC051023 TaxID=3155410 RepID=UPI00344C510E